MENRLIQFNEVEVGDEIIISAHSDLKYLKVLRLPKKVDSTTFKVSLRRDQRGNVHWKWLVNSFEQDIEKHNDVMYQNLGSRDIFLVKRENNN
jgi:hypothetical protein